MVASLNPRFDNFIVFKVNPRGNEIVAFRLGVYQKNVVVCGKVVVEFACYLYILGIEKKNS
jgi:hypothetical protein